MIHMGLAVYFALAVHCVRETLAVLHTVLCFHIVPPAEARYTAVAWHFARRIPVAGGIDHGLLARLH